MVIPLGISFRPRQAEAFGLDPRESLDALLSYPFEVAIAGNSRWGLYLDGSGHPWQRRRWAEILGWAGAAPGRRVLIAEGQAEPWEAITTCTYLFWGAEYWLLRLRHDDPSYLRAFTRILDGARKDGR